MVPGFGAGKITFADLDTVIQVLFGWDGGHAHVFSLPSLDISVGTYESSGLTITMASGNVTNGVTICAIMPTKYQAENN